MISIVDVKNAVVREPKLEDMTQAEALAEVRRLQAMVATMMDSETKGETVSNNAKKNQQPSKPSGSRVYVLLANRFGWTGKVPDQQADLVKLLASHMEVGKAYSEKQVFDLITDFSGEYSSLTKSKQDPVYVFRYYRGLAKKNNHCGFVQGNFLRVIG